MSSDTAPLAKIGDHVRVDTITPGDIPTYRRAVEGSRDRIRHWNPVNADDLPYHLRRQSDGHRTFLIRALRPPTGAGHDIVGKVNVTSITRGRAFSAVLGYDAYDPYNGRGLFAEGLRLIVDLCLEPLPNGLGLNRVEAAVQPGNVRSAGLLRSLGFRRRGVYPAYLWLGDGAGREAWRDHVVYGVDRSDWPARPYARHDHDAPIVVVTPRGRRITDTDVAAARALAREMGVPLLRDSSLDRHEQLADAVTGAVVLTHAHATGGIPAHDVVPSTDLTDPASVTRVALRVAATAHGKARTR